MLRSHLSLECNEIKLNKRKIKTKMDLFHMIGALMEWETVTASFTVKLRVQKRLVH